VLPADPAVKMPDGSTGASGDRVITDDYFERLAKLLSWRPQRRAGLALGGESDPTVSTKLKESHFHQLKGSQL